MPSNDNNKEEMMPPGNFSVNLRTALEEAGLTQAQLAERTGCTQPDISRYLSSDRLPSGDKIVAIAQALGTTAEELILGQRERAVAYNSLDVDEEAQPEMSPATAATTAAVVRVKRRGVIQRVRKLTAKAEEALKALREELEKF